jgi:hypothetical protein
MIDLINKAAHLRNFFNENAKGGSDVHTLAKQKKHNNILYPLDPLMISTVESQLVCESY